MVIMPNKEKTVTTVVKEYLMKRVGQTVVSKTIADATGESHSAVTGSLYTLKGEGKLKIEKTVGITKIYRVLPSISKTRPGDKMKRYTYKRGRRYPDGHRAHNGLKRFTVETGIKIPTDEVYPFGEMKVGDSFKFPKEMKSEVRAAAKKWLYRNKGSNFVFSDVGKKSTRCWKSA